MEVLREADRVLGIVSTLDRHVGTVKVRARGLTCGQLVVSLASCQMTGGDHLVSLDRRRADRAGQELEPVPTPPSTTAAGLARRFGDRQWAGIEAAIGEVTARMLALCGPVRRNDALREVTIDGDTTDVEVYGRGKRGAAYNYQGQRAYRPHIAFWAQMGVPLAADLMAGDHDPRPRAVRLAKRAIANLPAGVKKIRMRWDAGYFAVDLARFGVKEGIEFAIGAKRTKPAMLAARAVPDEKWVPVIGMEDTEVAVVAYLPGEWPAEVECLARRTRIPAEKVSADPRARRRRTIPKDQLALALDGKVDYVYGYSFILTNRDVSTSEKLVDVEYWYRHRTDIEALNRDAKHGAALRHLPSSDHAVNTVWMWAALLACAMSAWIQQVARLDAGNGRGRRTIARLRRELINVAARVTHHAGQIVIRLPPGRQLLNKVLPRLQAFPNPGYG